MESKKDKKLRTLIAYAYAWRGQLQENKNATLEDYNKAIALDPLPEITGIIYEDCFARIAEDLRTGQDQIMYALDCPNVPLLRENLIANS